MAHFAKIDENNIVTQVIVVDNNSIIDPFTDEESEVLGCAYCKKSLGGNWVQTSYNGRFRKRYAGIGYTYNKELDAFIPPKPFDSWVLNVETADWEPLIGPAPELTQEQLDMCCAYIWDDVNNQWQLHTPNLSDN